MKNRRKRQNIYPNRQYMTAHSPGLEQALGGLKLVLLSKSKTKCNIYEC